MKKENFWTSHCVSVKLNSSRVDARREMMFIFIESIDNNHFTTTISYAYTTHVYLYFEPIGDYRFVYIFNNTLILSACLYQQ